MSHRVLVTDKLAEEGLELLRAEPGLEVVVATKLDTGEAQGRAGRGRRDRDPVGDAADGRGARATSPGSRRSSAPAWASTTSTSPAATRQGIVVMNTPGGQHGLDRRAHHGADAGPVAERRPGQRQPEGRAAGTATSSPAPSSAARRWGSSAWAGSGLAVARRAQGFDMNVIGFDPFLSAERAAGARDRERLAARRPLGPVRLHHAAHPALGRDPQPDRRPTRWRR